MSKQVASIRELSDASLETMAMLRTPLWIFDIERARMLWANDAALALWHAPDLESLRARDFGADMSDATATRLASYLEAFRCGRVLEEQWTMYPEGRPTTVSCRCSGVRFRDRLAMLVEGHTVDARHVDPASLRDVEALRHTHAIITLCDRAGAVLMENPAAQRTHGLSRPDRSGEHLASRFADAKAGEAALARVRRGEVFAGEVQVRTLAGERWHYMEIRPTVDPVTGGDALLVHELDVTRRKQAEQALQQAHEELEGRVAERTAQLRALNETLEAERSFVEAILDTVGSLVVVTDGRGRIVRVNRAVTATTGRPAEALLGQPFWDALLTGEQAEQRQRVFARDPDPGFHERLPRAYECELETATGERRLISWTTRTIVDGQARLQHLVEAGLDVTEERQMQARLQLSDRLASLGTLAAGVAHEINNPLVFIIGNLELLEQHFDPQEDENIAPDELRPILQESLEGARRVQGIVRDLRSLSRPGHVEHEAVALEPAIETALRLASHELRHRARVERAYGEDVPPARAHAERLGQVLVNLLVNAAHAIEEGAAGDHAITIRTRRAGADRVAVDVADTGRGMDAETRRRIFDPFFTTRPGDKGTGLGLAISHRIVTEMDGILSVESELGRGTTFTCELPAAAARSQGPRAAARKPAPAGERSLRILVIDDEELVLRTTRRMLRGHTVETASSGREALARLRQDAGFDVILCDLMMSDLTGMGLWQEVGTFAPALQPRFLFMTGGTFTERSRTFLDECSNPSILKPFVRADLCRAVAALARDTPAPAPGERTG